MNTYDFSISQKFKFFITIPLELAYFFFATLDGPGVMDGRSQQAPIEVIMLLKRAYVKSPLNQDTSLPTHLWKPASMIMRELGCLKVKSKLLILPP